MVNLIFVFHNLNMDLKGPVIQKFGPGGFGGSPVEKIWWFRPVKGLIKGILRHHCEDYITPENECQTSELYAQGIYHEPVLIENIGRRPNFLGNILMKITMISNNFFFLNFEANNFF